MDHVHNKYDDCFPRLESLDVNTLITAPLCEPPVAPALKTFTSKTQTLCVYGDFTPLS